MELRVSTILYTLFDQCDFKILSDCTKLMDWIVSLVCQIEGGFLIYEGENVMNAHRDRLLEDGSFGDLGQLLRWMDLRVSPILYIDIEDLFNVEYDKHQT